MRRQIIEHMFEQSRPDRPPHWAAAPARGRASAVSSKHKLAPIAPTAGRFRPPPIEHALPSSLSLRVSSWSWVGA